MLSVQEEFTKIRPDDSTESPIDNQKDMYDCQSVINSQPWSFEWRTIFSISSVSISSYREIRGVYSIIGVVYLCPVVVNACLMVTVLTGPRKTKTKKHNEHFLWRSLRKEELLNLTPVQNNFGK